MPAEYGGPDPKDLGIAKSINRSPVVEEVEKMLPEQENRNGLVVNILDNKKVRSEISTEQLNGFIEVVRGRIGAELAHEKTTLPKDRLERLDEEVQANPEIVKA